MKTSKLKQKRYQDKLVKKLISLIPFLVLIFIIGIQAKQNKDLLVQIEELNWEIDQDNYEIAALGQSLNAISEEYKKDVETLNATIDDLNLQLEEMAEINKSYVDELAIFRERKELYDKYSYAIINDLGKRTDLTYEEIKLGETLMLEIGRDPHLMFGTIMVESGGDRDAVNKDSGATGYGQFLKSTGKWVYENLMGLKNYDPEIRKDGPTNIKMMARLYKWLYYTYDGDTLKVVKHYSGNSTNKGARSYLERINRFTNKVGVTVN